MAETGVVCTSHFLFMTILQKQKTSSKVMKADTEVVSVVYIIVCLVRIMCCFQHVPREVFMSTSVAENNCGLKLIVAKVYRDA